MAVHGMAVLGMRAATMSAVISKRGAGAWAWMPRLAGGALMNTFFHHERREVP